MSRRSKLGFNATWSMAVGGMVGGLATLVEAASLTCLFTFAVVGRLIVLRHTRTEPA